MKVGSPTTRLISQSKWIFCLLTKRTPDYKEIRAVIFKDWILNRFINTLKVKSLIVMDNVPQHLVTLENIPYTPAGISLENGCNKRLSNFWQVNSNNTYLPTK